MKGSQLFCGVDAAPNEAALQEGLQGAFSAYRAFMALAFQLGIAVSWRYYADGKAELCKGVHGKKTVFWLSVWEGFFKVSFYFTEKTRGGIEGLALQTETKERAAKEPCRGKLIPLILEICTEGQIAEAAALLNYKLAVK